MTFEKWWKEIVRYPQYRDVQVIAQEAWDMATKAERERCAKIAESMSSSVSSDNWDACADDIKAAILGESND